MSFVQGLFLDNSEISVKLTTSQITLVGDQVGHLGGTKIEAKFSRNKLLSFDFGLTKQNPA